MYVVIVSVGIISVLLYLQETKLKKLENARVQITVFYKLAKC